jgi:uncharacterized membrane protein
MAAERAWDDRKIEQWLGNLLRAGVLLAGFVVFCGGCIYLVRHGSAKVDYLTYRGEPPDYRTVTGIIRDALALRGRGMIQFGLLLLIATPIARVAFSVWGFAAERDRMYTVFTLIVLAILLFSLLGSGAA